MWSNHPSTRGRLDESVAAAAFLPPDHCYGLFVFREMKRKFVITDPDPAERPGFGRCSLFVGSHRESAQAI